MHDIFDNKAIDDTALKDHLRCASRMAGGIAHELNNAVGAIQNNVAIMQANLPVDTTLQKNLQHVLQAANNMMELSYLMQRYYTDGKIAGKTDSDLQPLLDKALTNLQPRLSANCTLNLPVDNALDMRLRTIPALLEETLTAILFNAADALGGEPGEISVTLTDPAPSLDRSQGLTLGTLPPGPGCQLEIKDTGTGMPPNVLRHIFDPFFTTRIRARGLGLTAVIGLVLHGDAAVQVRSHPHQGTTVRLQLPRGA